MRRTAPAAISRPQTWAASSMCGISAAVFDSAGRKLRKRQPCGMGGAISFDEDGHIQSGKPSRNSGATRLLPEQWKERRPEQTLGCSVPREELVEGDAGAGCR